MHMDYKRERFDTVISTVSGEITEKKSRFIATVFHVESEEEAVSVIADMKKKYWDARHNCYAYVIGIDNEVSRFSDDGEPGGTAGRPILDVLKNRGLTNTLVVVTRYFGGVLLGTGGLVRAYTDATVAALEEGVATGSLKTMCMMQTMKVGTDYNLSGKVQYLLSSMGSVVVRNIDYKEDVCFDVVVPVSEAESTATKITDVTNAKAVITMGETDYYPLTK